MSDDARDLKLKVVQDALLEADVPRGITRLCTTQEGMRVLTALVAWMKGGQKELREYDEYVGADHAWCCTAPAFYSPNGDPYTISWTLHDRTCPLAAFLRVYEEGFVDVEVDLAWDAALREAAQLERNRKNSERMKAYHAARRAAQAEVRTTGGSLKVLQSTHSNITTGLARLTQGIGQLGQLGIKKKSGR